MRNTPVIDFRLALFYIEFLCLSTPLTLPSPLEERVKARGRMINALILVFKRSRF